MMMQRRGFMSALAAALVLSLSVAGAARAESADHRVVLHLDENDPARMNMVLNNAANISRYYQDKGEEVEMRIVAYGPGLHMLRADTSPVKERVASAVAGVPGLSFQACGNTMTKMGRKEKKEIALIEGVTVVPSGVVALIEAQELGWSYVRP